jgi:hypothetical protein
MSSQKEITNRKKTNSITKIFRRLQRPREWRLSRIARPDPLVARGLDAAYSGDRGRNWRNPWNFVFLASSASDFVNGQIIYVDGGILAVI